MMFNPAHMEFIVQRHAAPFAVSLVTAGVSRDTTEKILGVRCGWDPYLYVHTDIYWDAKQLKEDTEQLKDLFHSDIQALFTMVDTWRSSGESLLQFSESLRDQQYDTVSNDLLHEQLLKLASAFEGISTALYVPLAIQDFLSEALRTLLYEKGVQEDVIDEYYQALVYPNEHSISTNELISFYTLAQYIQDTARGATPDILSLVQEPSIDKEIREYLAEFSFIGARYHWNQGWTREQLVERFKHIDWSQDFAEKIKSVSDAAKIATEKTSTIIQELNFNEQEQQIVKLAKQVVYIRTYRTDLMNKSGYTAQPLYVAIAQRLHIALDDVLHLTWYEVADVLQQECPIVPMKRIAQRKKAFIYERVGDRCAISEDSNRIAKYQALYTQEVQTDSDQSLQGVIANTGKYTGTAKVVLLREDISKIEPGDVLVTSMTAPSHVPIMEKAGAFVTNEGGITCHAAIIAREMNKPCIIGTKVATSIIQDGDTVTVDADTGEVRKVFK